MKRLYNGLWVRPGESHKKKMAYLPTILDDGATSIRKHFSRKVLYLLYHSTRLSSVDCPPSGSFCDLAEVECRFEITIAQCAFSVTLHRGSRRERDFAVLDSTLPAVPTFKGLLSGVRLKRLRPPSAHLTKRLRLAFRYRPLYSWSRAPSPSEFSWSFAFPGYNGR